MDLLKSAGISRAGEQLRTILHAGGMAAGWVGTDLRPLGIGGPRRACRCSGRRCSRSDSPCRCSTSSDRGAAAARGDRGYPVRPWPASAAARGLAHGRHACWKADARSRCCGRSRHERRATSARAGSGHVAGQRRAVAARGRSDRYAGPAWHVDRVLEPVRARLALLRPSRPLTLGRVLILPFEDFLVTPDEAWPGRRCFSRAYLAESGRAGLDRPAATDWARRLRCAADGTA